jgi:type IV pilus assembly protein PilW
MSITIKQSQGFSLVELLVAMVVGLIIVSGAFSMHSISRDTQKANEAQMDMVADARFAMETIAYDLRHAGMWGGTNQDGLISCRSTDAACVASAAGETLPAALAGDCAVGAYYNLTRPVFATDDSDGNVYSATCILAVEKYHANTDILEIRYADSNLATLTADNVFVRSNFVNGKVFVGTTEPELAAYDASPLTNSYPLRAYTYYISDFSDKDGDGIPSLRRVALVNGPGMENQTLVSGVDDFQVQFGEDLDNIEDANGNLTVDTYVDPNAVTDWTRVYSAKIWLLMRSNEKQIGVDTTKSYSIAGKAAKNYGGKDGYRYFLVSSQIDLRNLKPL